MALFFSLEITSKLSLMKPQEIVTIEEYISEMAANCKRRTPDLKQTRQRTILQEMASPEGKISILHVQKQNQGAWLWSELTSFISKREGKLNKET